MPRPRKNESVGDFVSRCMGSAEAQKTKPNGKERLGMCYGLYKQAKEEAAVAAREGRPIAEGFFDADD